MQSANTLPAIEAFRAGRHTDMHGNVVEITRAELQASARAYDPAVFAAPMVIGHPTTEAPAFGWLKKLTVNDSDTLIADDHTDVHPEFASLVLAKSYPKTSISFFRPAAKDNPVPGVWYPRHLGFLGATQPALNLKPVVAFSADESQYVTFGAYDAMTLANLFRSVKNFLLTKFTADSVAINDALPEYSLNDLQMGAARDIAEHQAKQDQSPLNYAAQQALAATQTKDDAMSAEQLKAAQDAVAAEKTRADNAVAQLAQTEARARAVSFAATAAALVTEGRLHPDEVENYVAFMAQPDDAQTVSFSAPDGTAKTFNAREFMANFIKRRAPLVELKEIAKGKAAGTTTVAFSAPSDLAVSADRADLHARATALAAENKLSYVDAVRQLEAA